MEQRPDRVVGVDAANSLDARLRDRLAIGDDRERLESRGRELDRLDPNVPGDERAGIGGSRELDAVAGEDEADPARREARLEIAEACIDGLAVDAREGRDLAPRQGPLGDEQESLELGLRQLRTAVRLGGRPILRGSRPVEEIVSLVDPPSAEHRQRLVDRIVVGDAGRPALVWRREARHDRAPRLGLLDDDLAPLHQLEHRQERDRDDDPVAGAAHKLLEHDERCIEEGGADDRRTLGEGDRARHGFRRRRSRRDDPGQAVERRGEYGWCERLGFGRPGPGDPGRSGHPGLAPEDTDPLDARSSIRTPASR